MKPLATFKHISSKNADYGAAEKYLTFVHDEFSMKPTLDENGRLILRENYRISTLNCGEEDFAVACMRSNMKYGKNQKREDVKSHHYIISFDPRDGADNGLTVDRAQQLGEEFCKNHFRGHQALVCTHPDGHNHSGNIHVHIVINSLRIEEVPLLPYMDRPADTRQGCKHRCTDAAMEYFKSEVMEMCHRENLYQIDLLHGSANRVTEREYWARKKGQAALDERNAEITAAGLTPRTTKFETDKEKLRQKLRAALDTSTTFEQFSALLLRQGITVKESRGRLSYLTPDRTKAITARKLGDDFDYAAVMLRMTPVLARLEQNAHRVVKERAAALKADKNAPKRSVIGRLNEKQTAIKNDGIQRTVDIEAKRAEGKGRGYEHWAKVHNLQQMAKAKFLLDTGFSSQEEFDTAFATAQADLQNARAALTTIEAKIAEKKELQKWVIDYGKTRDVRNEYKAQKTDKKKAAYRAAHEDDFVVADAAVRYFKSHGIAKIPTYRALQSEIEQLIAEKNVAYNAYYEAKDRHKELATIQHNLSELHGEPTTEKTKKKEQELE